MKHFLFIVSLTFVTNCMAQEVSIRTSDSSTKKNVMMQAEIMPQFPHGMDSMSNFINEHLRYPELAFNDDIQGTVLVNFVVDTTGSVGDVKVARSSGYKFLDEEALRIVKMFPNFTPGYQDDKKVKVRCQIPIEFAIDE